MQTNIRKMTERDIPQLVELWERSVRATHHFLTEADIVEIRGLLPVVYLPAVDVSVVEADGLPVGFIGLSADTIEMLFIDNGCRGKGFGSLLIDFALSRGVTSVDVNEQNPSALDFYLRKGFRVVGRDGTDEAGRPYPILHLSL